MAFVVVTSFSVSVAFSDYFFVGLLGLVSVVGLIDLDGLEFCKILVVNQAEFRSKKQMNSSKYLKNGIVVYTI